MRTPYDQQLEAVELLRELPAWAVVEKLGLSVTPRTVERWAIRAYGSRPTKRRLQRRDVLRDAVVHALEAAGLDRHYCLEAHRSFHPCLIRKVHVEPGIGSLAFVCHKHSRPGDC